MHRFRPASGDLVTRHVFVGRLDEALERRLRAADGFQAVSREDGRVHAFFTYDTVEHARSAADLIEGVRKGFSVDTLEQREAQAAMRAQEALRAVSVDGSASVQVPGMFVIDQVISDEEQAQFLAFVDAQPWDQLRLRRVQHYGHAFLYDRFNVDLSRKTAEPLPAIFEPLRRRLVDLLRKHTALNVQLDQLTVNDYPPKVGIAAHIDTHSAFRDGIVSVSMGGPCVMVFRKADDPAVARAVLLRPRSALFMTGEARYAWTHGIPSRAHNDDAEADGQACMRTRRVSLTWRAVLGAPCSCAFPAHCDSRAGSVDGRDGASEAQTTFI